MFLQHKLTGRQLTSQAPEIHGFRITATVCVAVHAAGLSFGRHGVEPTAEQVPNDSIGSNSAPKPLNPYKSQTQTVQTALPYSEAAV